MANRIVSVHAGIYGIGIYAIMLPSSGFSVAHCVTAFVEEPKFDENMPSCYDSYDLLKKYFLFKKFT